MNTDIPIICSQDLQDEINELKQLAQNLENRNVDEMIRALREPYTDVMAEQAYEAFTSIISQIHLTASRVKVLVHTLCDTVDS